MVSAKKEDDILRDKTACSRAFLEYMDGGNYFEAARCALIVLEVFGDMIRHHEMMLTVNLRRENVAAALENCNEILSYGNLKGLDVAEYAGYRDTLLHRLTLTRTYLVSRFWDEVMADTGAAPARYAAVPLILAGEASLQRSADTGALFFTFPIHRPAHNRADTRIACRLASCEAPFVETVSSPSWVAVHGRFFSVSGGLILLEPCHCLGQYDSPLQ